MFSPDTQHRHAVDAPLGLRRCTTGGAAPTHLLTGPQAGFASGTHFQPMLAAANRGIACSRFGAQRIARWPVGATVP